MQSDAARSATASSESKKGLTSSFCAPHAMPTSATSSQPVYRAADVSRYYVGSLISSCLIEPRASVALHTVAYRSETTSFASLSLMAIDEPRLPSHACRLPQRRHILARETISTCAWIDFHEFAHPWKVPERMGQERRTPAAFRFLRNPPV
jgi:hypothetical protein